MYQDFIAALNKKYNCSDKSELSGIDLQHYNFGASTNSRGQDAIGVFEAYGFSMTGLKILDVGCAYGGFSIEAARKGAYCYGVEISNALYEFAMLNNKGEKYDSGSCDFVRTDATSPEFLEKLPHNYFDLIIVNDVFEHVYDTVQLLSNLDKVANEKCAIYFVIPNGSDFRFVAREGHTGCCGISLMAPLLWQTLIPGRESYERSIYYRQYEYYRAMFEYFGFGKIALINYPGYAKEEETRKNISAGFETAKQKIEENENSFPDVYAQKLHTALEGFGNQLRYDLEHLDAPELVWKYMTNFWGGFAQKQERVLKPLVKTCERTSKSDLDVYGISFVFSRRDQTLEIDITEVSSDEELDFAFHLMRRGESIDRSRYQRERHYEWELKAPGMYWAAVYVKKSEREHKDCRILTQPLYMPEDKE